MGEIGCGKGSREWGVKWEKEVLKLRSKSTGWKAGGTRQKKVVFKNRNAVGNAGTHEGEQNTTRRR